MNSKLKRLIVSAIVIIALFSAVQFTQSAWTQESSSQASPQDKINKPKIHKPKIHKPKIHKPQLSDTVKANVYADNWFVLYINNELAVVDSIKFIPHNVVSVDLLPSYPMTIAVMAKDNADSETGMEYANTNIGDVGFILKFGDGTATNANWKARSFSHGPIDHDTKNPKLRIYRFRRIGSQAISMTAIGRMQQNMRRR